MELVMRELCSEREQKIRGGEPWVERRDGFLPCFCHNLAVTMSHPLLSCIFSSVK